MNEGGFKAINHVKNYQVKARKLYLFTKAIQSSNDCHVFSRFVSDHAPAGYQALLQHRVIQAGQKMQLCSGSPPETARTYPLSLLEWTANRKRANMVLHVHSFDGNIFRLFSSILKACITL